MQAARCQKIVKPVLAHSSRAFLANIPNAPDAGYRHQLEGKITAALLLLLLLLLD